MPLGESLRLTGNTTIRLVSLLTLAACGNSLGEPSERPLPTPDPYPVLLETGPLAKRVASYRIEVTLDPVEHRLHAHSVLSWRNTGQRPLQVMPFHLYMNAFKNEASVFMRESRGRHRRARAADDGWGWIDVTSVQIAGVELIDTARYPHEPDETVMELPLPTPLMPGASVDVAMRFEVKLPEVFARTGFKGPFHMIGQWFPKPGKLVGAAGSEEWHCEPFHLNSEFFADFGTYDVNISAPSTHVIVGTGVLKDARDSDNGMRTHTYRAEDVHDFVWMADPYMEVISDTATTDNGPVQVRVYHRPRQREFARRHLRAGVGAIEHFSRLYRTYPWPIMSIIDPPLDAASGAGGMEYPTVVTTAGDSVFMRPGVRLPELVTVHEVGHNWFQGMLASNEVDEAWLDEGINEYADWVVLNAIYGEGRNALDWRGLRGDSLELSTAIRRIDGLAAPIDTRSYEFPDSSTYGAATYGKTGAIMRSLEAAVGRERFRAAFRNYTQRYAFRHPTGEDLFRTLEESLGPDVRGYLVAAFRDIGSAAFELQNLNCRKVHEPRGVFGRGDNRRSVTRDDAPDSDTWRCDILIANLGRIPIAVDVEVTFADGTVQMHRFEPTTERAWQRITVERASKVEQVRIDPDRQILVNTTPAAGSYRKTPDRAASRRAAARVGFWAQTAMQVTGL